MPPNVSDNDGERYGTLNLRQLRYFCYLSSVKLFLIWPDGMLG